MQATFAASSPLSSYGVSGRGSISSFPFTTPPMVLIGILFFQLWLLRVLHVVRRHICNSSLNLGGKRKKKKKKKLDGAIVTWRAKPKEADMPSVGRCHICASSLTTTFTIITVAYSRAMSVKCKSTCTFERPKSFRNWLPLKGRPLDRLEVFADGSDNGSTLPSSELSTLDRTCPKTSSCIFITFQCDFE